MSHFASGVTIVTTRCKGKPYGLTVNAFSSVSLEPPLVLVCIDKRAISHAKIIESGEFAVNILSRDQEDISDLFARPGLRQKFDNVQYDERKTGSPILDGAIGYLECRLKSVYTEGDHSVIVGKVVSLAVGGKADPLVFYQGRYCNVDLRMATIPQFSDTSETHLLYNYWSESFGW